MLISEHYRALNKQLHADRPDYGTSSSKMVAPVIGVIAHEGYETLLDYGCGKGLLKVDLLKYYEANPVSPPEIFEYDPAIEGKDTLPKPADLVVCSDVLEHVEPECLPDVLDHLRLLTKRIGLFTAALVPAKKLLADGRNAHLLVRSADWWYMQLRNRFDVVHFNAHLTEARFMVRPKKEHISHA